MSEAAAHTWDGPTLARRALMPLLLISLAAGCGTEQGALNGSDQALKDAGSSRIEISLVGGQPPFDYTGTGAIDYAHNRGELVMRSGAGDAPGGELHAVFVGPDAYLGMKLLGKDRWQKEPEVEITGPERFIPGPAGPSPDRLLALLTKSSTKVETIGDETIRGTPTKHYRAHVDKAKLGEEDSSYLPDDLVVDAWVDDSGLVRRLRVPLGGESAPVYTVDLFDFGVDVHVKAPPDDEIVSEDEFSKLLDRECLRERRYESLGEDQFCAIIMASGSDSGTEYGPTVTMPTTVPEGK